MPDSNGAELEELQRRKEEMLNRLEAIKQDRLALEESIHILREKNAIRELEGQMRAEQNVLSKLSFEKQELEERLNQPIKLSIINAIEQARKSREDNMNTKETEATDSDAEQEEQSEAAWKEPEEEAESDKEPEEEGKKRLGIF